MKSIITIALIFTLSACGSSSVPDTSNADIDNIIETLNEIPVANAGMNQDVITFLPVVLNGGASSDPQNDPLTFSWTLESKPQGSTSILFSTESITPSFSPDVDGVYTINLIVNDGVNDSLKNTVLITAITFVTPPSTDVFTGAVSRIDSNRYDVIGDDIYILTSSCLEIAFFDDVKIRGDTIEFVDSGNTCSITNILAKDNLSNGDYVVTVSRDTSNWYEVKFVGGYIETSFCFEFVFFDNAILNIDFSGTGTLHFENGNSCQADGYYSTAEL